MMPKFTLHCQNTTQPLWCIHTQRTANMLLGRNDVITCSVNSRVNGRLAARAARCSWCRGVFAHCRAAPSYSTLLLSVQFTLLVHDCNHSTCMSCVVQVRSCRYMQLVTTHRIVICHACLYSSTLELSHTVRQQNNPHVITRVKL